MTAIESIWVELADRPVKNQYPKPVTATNNWWGTTDASAIRATVWDLYNDSRFGLLTYQPFLTAPANMLP